MRKHFNATEILILSMIKDGVDTVQKLCLMLGMPPRLVRQHIKNARSVDPDCIHSSKIGGNSVRYRLGDPGRRAIMSKVPQDMSTFRAAPRPAQRWCDCPIYDSCLDYAARCYWPSWTCEKCCVFRSRRSWSRISGHALRERHKLLYPEQYAFYDRE